MQLMVVEDDEQVSKALVAVLDRQGFDVVKARDGASALATLTPATDLVLLDLGLPDMDGFEVCWRIRKMSDAPVIMATGRSPVHARVKGFELGADDYVTKPYDLREILARVEAVLRRRRRETDEALDGPVVVDGVTIDLATRRVLRPDRSEVALTRKEFDILGLLAQRRGSVVRRERLLRNVWGSGWKGLERTLEVHVASLRRKLGEHALVETVRGVGYRLATTE
ncbi:response regulator transcription factor [Georgenia alba]|uniref:Sensory transduction protein RegX3 n=1 Tax=Georgenia alba TaxID=2233858 RepID=A0ABW2Q5S4_9MICO